MKLSQSIWYYLIDRDLQGSLDLLLLALLSFGCALYAQLSFFMKLLFTFTSMYRSLRDLVTCLAHSSMAH